MLLAGYRDGRAREFQAGRSLIGPHRDDLDAEYREKAMAVKSCSTGEQKAILISVLLANARAVAARFSSAPLLLLDEVAAHLDPERREALFCELHDMGAQVWLTGTEKELFSSQTPMQQMFAVRDEGGLSVVAEV